MFLCDLCHRCGHSITCFAYGSQGPCECCGWTADCADCHCACPVGKHEHPDDLPGRRALRAQLNTDYREQP
jgi:hypothetical protein